MSRLLAFLLTCTISFAQELSYQDAYRIATSERKPLIAFVTSPNCGPCRAFERDTLDPAIRSGEFAGCVFVKLSTDTNAAITDQMMSQTKQRGTPQLLLYAHGKMLSLHGNQPIAKVRQLVTQINSLNQ